MRIGGREWFIAKKSSRESSREKYDDRYWALRKLKSVLMISAKQKNADE